MLAMADANISLFPLAFSAAEADALFRDLRESIDWRQETVRLFGRAVRIPRLSDWHGEAPYTYSGLSMKPKPWTPPLAEIKQRVEDLSGHRFNGVLLNLYRDGRDSMSWHSDDEPELGPNPAIASVSLGATRRFRLRHRIRKDDTRSLDLTGGSLLVMDGPTQHHWHHSVPKTAKTVGERINLTFRLIRN
jgi:alkylated DNA repair dioxygenase AlkB